MSKPGPKPIEKHAMTAVERTKRSRMKTKLLHEGMRTLGYVPVTVFLPKEHLTAIDILEKGLGQSGISLSDPTKLSIWISRFIRKGVEDSVSITESEKLDSLVTSDAWPKSFLQDAAQTDMRVKLGKWMRAGGHRTQSSQNK